MNNTHLPNDAEAGLVERCRASRVSETACEGFLSELPLRRSLVVGLVNLMPMALKQERTIGQAKMNTVCAQVLS